MDTLYKGIYSLFSPFSSLLCEERNDSSWAEPGPEQTRYEGSSLLSLMSLLLIKLGHIPESIAGIELPLPSPISGANFLASFYLPVSPNTQPTP